MQAMSLIGRILSRLERRNRDHPLRLYGTLVRGAVWACMNREGAPAADLRHILRWGVRRELMDPHEARRLWALVGMLAGAAPAADGPVRTAGELRTRLNRTPGVSRPWQEWATERIERGSGKDG